jgi:hypothetical protein
LNQRKLAQEAMTLRQQNERKSHDLKAIIWKMNELHLINKTFNEKMANRDQHVHYLEECLMDLQNTNRYLVMEKQSSDLKLRDELENLQILIDAMTIPLWQFGECGVTKRNLTSRIVLPVRGANPRQLIQSGDWDEEMIQHLKRLNNNLPISTEEDSLEAQSLQNSICTITDDMIFETPEETSKPTVEIQDAFTKEKEKLIIQSDDLQRKEKELLDSLSELNDREEVVQSKEKEVEEKSAYLNERFEKLKSLETEVKQPEKESDITEKKHYGLVRMWCQKESAGRII